jgi:ribosome biogenesis GTPase A
LYKLNKSVKCRSIYLKYFEMMEPSNSINTILVHIASTRKLYYGGVKIRPVGGRHLSDQFQGLDLERAAETFITAFRKGELGLMTLDDCSSEAVEAWFESEEALESSVAE